MKEISVENLAYYLKQAGDRNLPKPIFFLGAGASVSGKIPLDIDIVVWNGEIIRPQDWKQDYFQTGLKELEQMT